MNHDFHLLLPPECDILICSQLWRRKNSFLVSFGHIISIQCWNCTTIYTIHKVKIMFKVGAMQRGKIVNKWSSLNNPLIILHNTIFYCGRILQRGKMSIHDSDLCVLFPRIHMIILTAPIIWCMSFKINMWKRSSSLGAWWLLYLRTSPLSTHGSLHSSAKTAKKSLNLNLLIAAQTEQNASSWSMITSAGQ